MADSDPGSYNTVTTWAFVDPDKVSYPPPVEGEEDGYESDDDYLPPDPGLKSYPRPLPAKTGLVSTTSDATFYRTMRIPHFLRDNCFTVDIIMGVHYFDKSLSAPYSRFASTNTDFFITGYNLCSPASSASPSDKRYWFESLLARAVSDHKKSTTKWMSKRLQNEGLQKELTKLDFLGKTVVEEFLRYLDFKNVWDEMLWLREALGCIASIAGCPFPFELSTFVIAAGLLTFINRSSTAKAVLASLDAHLAFRYLPVFFPRRIDSMLRHWVSLDLITNGEPITDTFRANFQSVWLHGWACDDDAHWNVPEQSKNNLKVEIRINPQLKQLDEAARMDGRMVFGFHSLVPFGLEAKYPDFVQSDIFKQLGKLDSAFYKVYAKLRDRCTNKGHTFLWEGYLYWFFKEGELTPSEFNQALKWLQSKGVIVMENRPGRKEKAIMLTRYYEAECGIAKTFRKLLNTASKTNENLKVDLETPEFQMFKCDVDQVTALKALSEHPLVVLNGRAGAGKTQVVSAYIKAALKKLKGQQPGIQSQGVSQPQPANGGFVSSQRTQPGSEQKQKIQVLLTAPTGKAASVLEKRIGIQAYTLHAVMRSFTLTDGVAFEQAKIWVVDECSMVPVTVFNRVFSLLMENANIQKVILLGDRQQLPSVDPGNFLGDLYDGLKTQATELCVDLRTNHRAEATTIIENAKQIIGMCWQDLDMTAEDRFRVVNINAPTCFRKPWDERLGLVNHRHSQMISFTNEVVNGYNAEALKYYRAGGDLREFVTRNSEEGDAPPRKEPHFLAGDKVICTKNTDVRILYDKPGTVGVIKPKRFSNGSQFIIIEDYLRDMQGIKVEQGDEPSAQVDPGSGRLGRSERFLKLDDLGGDVIVAHYGDIVKKAKLKLAWALTVHKFQGSETDHVTYVLSGKEYETCQVVYTAVTRGKKSVTLVGTREGLNAAIKRKPEVRWTTLKQRLIAALSAPISTPEPPSESSLSSVDFGDDDAVDFEFDGVIGVDTQAVSNGAASQRQRQGQLPATQNLHEEVNHVNVVENTREEDVMESDDDVDEDDPEVVLPSPVRPQRNQESPQVDPELLDDPVYLASQVEGFSDDDGEWM